MKLNRLRFGLLLAIMVEMDVLVTETTTSQTGSEKASELVVENGKLMNYSRLLESLSETVSSTNLAAKNNKKMTKKKKKTTKKTTTRKLKNTTASDTTFYVSQNFPTTTTPDPFSGLIFDWTVDYQPGQTRSTEVVDQQYSKCSQVSSVFAIVSLIEGAYASLINKAAVAYSKQQALDCFASFSCDTYTSLKTVGATLVNYAFYSQTDYPYTGVKGKCKAPLSGVSTVGYIDILYQYTTETNLIDGLKKYDPAAAELNDVNLIRNYKNGVWTCTPTAEKFGAVITGYGVDKDVKYWRLKGSFGKSWGENGYFRVIRGGTDPCGILSYVVN